MSEPFTESSSRCRRPRRGCWGLLGLLLLAGCPAAPKPQSGPVGLPFEGRQVRLLVVDDPPLAEAAARLAGEWQSRTGARLSVEECTAAALATGDRPAADAVICPSAELPSVAQGAGLLPLPGDVLHDKALAWLDILPNIRTREATYHGEPCAVPLGSPALVCYYRADLLEKCKRDPPKTWGEYQALAAFLADRQNLGDDAPPADALWHGALEPLAQGWAGVTLLARAAGYAKHPYSLSTLFQRETMEPLIAGPPFVRALEELAATARLNGANAPLLDPAGVRAAFWKGEAALALSWPHVPQRQGGAAPAGAVESGSGSLPKIAVGFAELPGAEAIYDPARQVWENRRAGDVHRVTLISAAGRVGVVPRSAAQPEAAWQLLYALAAPDWHASLREASPSMTLFRLDQVEAPRAWVEPQADYRAALKYAAVARESQSRSEYLAALRIPGRSRYLAALDKAVEQTLSGEASPAEALSAAAEAWRQITAELGIDAQRTAYQDGLER